MKWRKENWRWLVRLLAMKPWNFSKNLKKNTIIRSFMITSIQKLKIQWVLLNRRIETYISVTFLWWKNLKNMRIVSSIFSLIEDLKLTYSVCSAMIIKKWKFISRLIIDINTKETFINMLIKRSIMVIILTMTYWTLILRKSQ